MNELKMCGICGFTRNGLSKEGSRFVLRTMCNVLDHRGPDDEGFFVDKEIALGHRRLSVIDLSPAGHQPMSTKDDRIWITYNGEIYNFRDLRSDLTKRGFHFQTRSDTEVILGAYTTFGEEFVEHLNGMFAFVLWDATKGQLLLARDRLGKKPLYYYYDGKKFIFASEIKAILAVPGVQREIDFEALDLYLTYGYIPAPWSIFKHIRKVHEASILIYANGHIREQRYWEIPANEANHDSSEERTTEELEALLSDAVRCRLVSDVPLGAFLSGGVDSSAIVSTMSRVSDEPVRTFTIDFAEDGYSERDDAERVARHCDTQHHVLEVKTDAVNLLPKLVWHFDEPFADSSAIPTYYVSKMAREHVTVILSGDGGDELFAGYNNYLKKDQYQFLLRMPYSIRKRVFGAIAQVLPVQAPGRNLIKFLATASSGNATKLGIYPYIKEDLLTGSLQQELNKYDAWYPQKRILSEYKHLDKLTRLQFLDTRLYLPGDILVKLDRMSMANSLETRAPLLDYRLVEFVAKLPVQFKMRGNTSKYLLKKLLKPYLPGGIVTKPKHGFAVPINRWFQSTLNGFTKEILLDSRCRNRGLFQPRVVENVLECHASGRRDYATWIWLMLNLELWFQTFMDDSSRRI